MSTFAGSVLASGQLPNAKGTLYTVPALTTAYVKFVNAHNGSAVGTETVNVYVKPSGGTSRRIAHGQLAQYEQLRVIETDETLTLGAGALIEGDSTTAATVDYLITGVLET